MFSITTAEIRWFLPGKVPESMIEWLKTLPGLFEQQAPRTDVYLKTPGCSTLGIKLREGRLEVKKLIQVEKEHKIGMISGIPERWIKWSSATTDDLKTVQSHYENTTHWVHVYKQRYLQKFAWSDKNGLELPPQYTYPSKGISMELTEVEVSGMNGWTMGVEAFGSLENVFGILIQNLPELLNGIPPSDFDRSTSMSYPEWILKVQ